MVQEELEANNNGLAIFNFSDITTFKVTVMNADDEAVKAMENGTEMVQKNDTEKNNQNFDKQIDIKNEFDDNINSDTEKIQKRYRKLKCQRSENCSSY
jgi:ATP-dependent DNA helicase RecG